ncbi:hypothetical protein GE061_005287 [Apolygus lucorum]|uniref:G-protein coupled receptors family 1 profile domain-containing protein n=1 Tax=Apolygus lucorum TaxID=248454 RepID=A0A8S9WV82_APOLU|nr:hypothetical protein GE061_005287 [Apolygus lucorum]
MEWNTEIPENSLSEDSTDFYTYIQYLEAISGLALEEINFDELGFDPKLLLIAYSMLSAFTLLGITGNVFSMIVWSRPQLKSSSAVLLTALAASDIVIVTSTNTWQLLATLILNYRTPFFEWLYYNIFPFIVVWMDPIALMSEMASTYLTVAITLERYIAVCHPFYYQELCSYGRSCKTAGIVIIVSILYNLIEFWSAEVRPHFHEEKNMTIYGVHETKLWKSPSVVKDIYENHLFLFVMYLFPLASISILNIAMCRQGNEERKLTDLQKKERRLTMMLVYVVVEFAVCTATIGFIGLCDLLDVSRFQIGFDMFWMAPLMVFSRTFNSSVNFITYITFGGPFRQTFMEMFCCCQDPPAASVEPEQTDPEDQETSV